MTDTIPGRTVAEVFGRFENELTRQTALRRKLFHGRKLSAEAMTNAIVLHFLDLPEGERDSIVDRFVPAYESLTSRTDPRFLAG